MKTFELWRSRMSVLVFACFIQSCKYSGSLTTTFPESDTHQPSSGQGSSSRHLAGVGRIEIQFTNISAPSGSPGMARECTGALISPSLVLTAAHCFECQSKQASQDSNGVFRFLPSGGGSTLRDEQAQFVITDRNDNELSYQIIQYWSMPKAACPAEEKVNYAPDEDLAIAVLKDPVSITVAKPFLVGGRIPDLDDWVYICKFGQRKTTICEGVRWNPGGELPRGGRDTGQAIVEPTDSGGPLVYQSSSEKWDTIFGVTSALTKNFVAYGDVFVDVHSRQSDLNAQALNLTGGTLPEPKEPLRKGRMNAQRILGISSIATSAAALLGSSALYGTYVSRWNDTKVAHCQVDESSGPPQCDPTGLVEYAKLEDMRKWGQGILIGGLVGMAAGALLTVLSDSSRVPRQKSQIPWQYRVFGNRIKTEMIWDF